jgi:hypothetical protein
MQKESVWVIKNEKGHYINLRKRNHKYYLTTSYTGITTGFAFYTNEETMKNDLNILGKGYHSEYISLKNIPNGERIKTD